MPGSSRELDLPNVGAVEDYRDPRRRPESPSRREWRHSSLVASAGGRAGHSDAVDEGNYRPVDDRSSGLIQDTNSMRPNLSSSSQRSSSIAISLSRAATRTVSIAPRTSGDDPRTNTRASA